MCFTDIVNSGILLVSRKYSEQEVIEGEQHDYTRTFQLRY